MITRPSGFTGVDGTYRLLPDGSAERSLAILEVQRFGATIVEPATGLPSTAPPPTASNSGFNIFNFMGQ